jgi:hypothetical protein
MIPKLRSASLQRYKQPLCNATNSRFATLQTAASQSVSLLRNTKQTTSNHKKQ